MYKKAIAKYITKYPAQGHDLPSAHFRKLLFHDHHPFKRE